MGRFNAAIAVRITRIVGTMYCAYVFTLVALVALPAAIQQGSATVLVNWLSSNFLQLVLLPIIIVGQNVISAAQDARAEADHETLTALHMMSRQQLAILEGQTEILDLLNTTDLTPMRAPDLRRLSEKCFDASSPPKSTAFRSCRCRAPAETGQLAFCLSRSSISFWPLRIWICWTDI